MGWIRLVCHAAGTRNSGSATCSWRARLPESWLTRLRSVLRGALRLQLLGVEHAIVSETAIGQGLRIVFESVWRRFSPGVRHGQRQVVFFQHEVNARSGALDRPGHHISRDAQSLGIGVVAHAVQFLDGDVVALAVLYAGIGEIAERKQNQHGYRHRISRYLLVSLDMKPSTLSKTLRVGQLRVKTHWCGLLRSLRC